MSNRNIQPKPANGTWQRREFVATILTVLGGSYLSAATATPNVLIKTGDVTPITIQEIIDLILKTVPGAPFKGTVDTVKSGDPGQQAKGIVSTMFATDEVIQKTIALGANFIIAHEPTFYNHLDETAWLQDDAVYNFKKGLLQKNGIVVWRFHDHWHAHQPDGIRYGVLKSLGWENKIDKQDSACVELPGAPLADIISLLKKQLGIQTVKVIGDLKQSCKRIAILPGMAGGQSQIKMLEKEKPDLLICGELNEWETAEYIRDARYQGMKTALVVTGHAVSEEPGMRWLVEWLQPQVPGIKITHIPSGDPFIYS